MIQKIIKRISDPFLAIKYKDGEKIFCIGRNKTGTTSMSQLFNNLGYRVASQRPAELLIEDWQKGDFAKIIRFAKYRGEVFQDIPFSLPGTYKILDEEFKNAKFILTVRDSPDEWYSSLINFHSKVFGNGSIPQKTDLLNASYIYPGWAWKAFRCIYDTPEEDLYNKEILINSYINYNNDVQEYFKDKPNQLIVINLKDEDTNAKLRDFLALESPIQEIPWENRT